MTSKGFPWATRYSGHFPSACSISSHPPGEAQENLQIIRRMGHAQVDPGVGLDVFGNRPEQAGVHGAYPFPAVFAGHRGEEFRVAGERAEERMTYGKGIHDFRVVTRSIVIGRKAQAGIDGSIEAAKALLVNGQERGLRGPGALTMGAGWGGQNGFQPAGRAGAFPRVRTKDNSRANRLVMEKGYPGRRSG